MCGGTVQWERTAQQAANAPSLHSCTSPGGLLPSKTTLVSGPLLTTGALHQESFVLEIPGCRGR